MPIDYFWYGDDFTGASDTLATLAMAGVRSALCLDVPTPERLSALGDLEALGIAGSARSLAPEAMRAVLMPVGGFVRNLGARLVHYKCCSTFDSAPEVGNLAVALRTLQPFVGSRFVPIIGGQPSLGRYCVFGQLFAAAGTGGEVFRIDRHPTMAHHPVTPMTEADLRRHLAAQGLDSVSLINWRVLEAGAPVSEGITVFDALHDGHVAAIGELIWSAARRAPVLAIGASRPLGGRQDGR
jgi:uncharacterized protein YgbK (DUF1537 family)